MTRIAIVAGTCVANDAISNAAVAHAELSLGLPSVEEVTFFAPFIDRPIPCDGVVISSADALLAHPLFKKCDVAIFHWGIWYPLFDAIPQLAQGGPRPIVSFHNMTPPHLVSPENKEIMERSRVQIQGVISLPHVTVSTFSEFNRRTLLEWRMSPERIAALAFPVDALPILDPREITDELHVLTVGRIVPAKGVHTVIEAVALAQEDLEIPISLRIVGSSTFGDPAYVDSLHRLIEDKRLHGRVTFHADATDEELAAHYAWAHVLAIGSTHEGLCVPVIEAYRSGLRVVTTNAGNLEFIVQPPDATVPVGSAVAMSEALVTASRQSLTTTPHKSQSIDYFSSAAVVSQLKNLLY